MHPSEPPLDTVITDIGEVTHVSSTSAAFLNLVQTLPDEPELSTEDQKYVKDLSVEAELCKKRSFWEAMAIPRWRDSIYKEIRGLYERGCFVIVPNTGQPVLGTRYVFKVKDDIARTFKSRMVIQGFLERVLNELIATTTSTRLAVEWQGVTQYAYYSPWRTSLTFTCPCKTYRKPFCMPGVTKTSLFLFVFLLV